MSFKEKYTTAELVSKEETQDPKEWSETYTAEKDKIVLSNDAYAVCQLLETLINKLGGL